MLRLMTQEPVQLDVTRPTPADVSGIRPSHFRKIQRKETCSHVKSKQAVYQVRTPPQFTSFTCNVGTEQCAP
jgi:hypothetical protein